MGGLATNTAPHTTVQDGGHRLKSQGVGIVFDGQGGAARNPDARVVSCASVRVHSKLLPDHPLTFFDGRSHQRLFSSLLVEHALGLRNHHLGALVLRRQGLFHDLLHGGNVIGFVDCSHPLNTDTFDGFFNLMACASARVQSLGGVELVGCS